MKKRKTMRKAVSWFLTVSLFVSAFSFPAFAETKEENTHQVTFVIVYRKPPAVPGSSQKALALHRK